MYARRHQHYRQILVRYSSFLPLINTSMPQSERVAVRCRCFLGRDQTLAQNTGVRIHIKLAWLCGANPPSTTLTRGRFAPGSHPRPPSAQRETSADATMSCDVTPVLASTVPHCRQRLLSIVRRRQPPRRNNPARRSAHANITRTAMALIQLVSSGG